MATKRQSVLTAGILLAALNFPSVLCAAESIRAEVQLSKKGGNRTTVELLSLDKDGVKLREKGKKFDVKVPYKVFGSIRVAFSDDVRTGVAATARQDWEKVRKHLAPVVPKLVPLLQIEKNNIGTVVDSYGRALVELDATKELTDLYRLIAQHSVGQQRQVASAWLAYLSARADDFAPVEKLAQNLKDVDQYSELYALRNISLAYMYRAQNKPEAALESISVVSALGDLGLKIYPEAVFLSGLCYEDRAKAQLEEELQTHAKEVETALISERISMGKVMQEAASKADEPPPTEEAILAAVDTAAVERSVGEPPTLEEMRYWAIAQDIFVFVERVFPNNRWAEESKKLIAPETRSLAASRNSSPEKAEPSEE